MVTPYEEYVAVCEKLTDLTPGDHEKRVGALQLRRRGGGERRQGRAPPHRPRRDRRLRPRLPRPHEPHDGADGEEHALQAPLRPVRRRGLPRPDGLPLPLAGRRRRRARRRPSTRSSRPCTPRWARTTAPRCSSSRSRARAASSSRRRGGSRGWRSGAASTASCSSPTRSRPASPHRRLVRLRPRGCRPDLHHHRQGHGRGPAARRRHGSRGRHGLRPRRRPRRHLRRQPRRLRRRARRDRDHGGRGPAAAGPGRSRPPSCRGSEPLAERHPDRVGDVRGRGAMLAVELVSDGPGRTPDAALAGSRPPGLPRRRAW